MKKVEGRSIILGILKSFFPKTEKVDKRKVMLLKHQSMMLLPFHELDQQVVQRVY